ncbi:hypothetical protein, partial [Salmonella sp. SAL4435]|uniref:hypothetical protein n=1 Tax=Salmonella sp. SAL4435 TaxID=3159890 RepID=UPI00397E1B91
YSTTAPGFDNGTGLFPDKSHLLSPTVPRSRRRVTVKQLQAEFHETIERLLAFLDNLDPDPDTEEQCDDEGVNDEREPEDYV